MGSQQELMIPVFCIMSILCYYVGCTLCLSVAEFSRTSLMLPRSFGTLWFCFFQICFGVLADNSVSSPREMILQSSHLNCHSAKRGKNTRSKQLLTLQDSVPGGIGVARQHCPVVSCSEMCQIRSGGMQPVVSHHCSLVSSLWCCGWPAWPGGDGGASSLA